MLFGFRHTHPLNMGNPIQIPIINKASTHIVFQMDKYFGPVINPIFEKNQASKRFSKFNVFEKNFNLENSLIFSIPLIAQMTLPKIRYNQLF